MKTLIIGLTIGIILTSAYNRQDWCENGIFELFSTASQQAESGY